MSNSEFKPNDFSVQHHEKQSSMRTGILEMLHLQESINTQITDDWREQHYPWYRGAWIEAAELMDHIGWKWWKYQPTNLEQLQLELVDIWHFGLSDCLQHCQDKSLTADALYRSVYLVSLVPNENSLLKASETFATDCLQLKRFPTLSFGQLLAAAQFDFHSLTKIYLGKNILNSFRQRNGYKSGEYNKIWGGLEDNEHLSQILKEFDTQTRTDTNIKDFIYHSLEQRYLQTVTG